VTLDLPAGISAANATLNGANCTVQTATITCSLGLLASAASVTGTASLVASHDGSAVLQARIAGDYVDPNAEDDIATATISVTSPATALQSTSSGGGGGSASWPLLWALLALFGLKNLQRR
jgi:MYXO-CTERM domain-containing protein